MKNETNGMKETYAIKAATTATIPPRHAKFQKSLEWLKEASAVIPGATSTMAKTPYRLFPGHMAICCAEAKGSRFIDVDGNEWLDCEMAMGTTPWGHARPEVNEAIIRQLGKGTSFSTAGELELTAAKLILRRFGGRYEAIRFAKNGADAVSGAIRIARAFTGREKVMATAYHGWHDWSAYGYYGLDIEGLGLTASIAETTIWAGHDTAAGLAAQLAADASDIACIVLCPNEWEPEPLREVVQQARRCGILVIFDEVTSGIRMGKQSTAGELDLWPDLLCISKGMANGLPLSALLGTRELLELSTQVKFSSAHATETIALAAAIACERLMEQAPVWPSWRGRTEQMMERLQACLLEHGLEDVLELKGTYASFCIRRRDAEDFYKDTFRERLVKSLAAEGIFTKGFFVFSDCHSEEELSRIEQSILSVIQSWRTAI
jgi:glutamate-1-semialdehyde 2,1-aminomutase